MSDKPTLPKMPQAAAWLTEHDDGPMVWLDRAEALSYCDEESPPVDLVRADQLRARDAEVWRAAMEQAAQLCERIDCESGGGFDAFASAIRSLPLPDAAEEMSQ